MESDDVVRARAELAALDGDRAALADRVRQPWWYDAAAGLLVFLLFGALSLRSLPVLAVAVVVVVAGLLGLKRAYERHTGMWVNGLRQGPTQRAARVWLGVYAVVVGGAALLATTLDWWWAFAVAGVVLGVTVAVVSRWWTTIYQRELRNEL